MATSAVDVDINQELRLQAHVAKQGAGIMFI